MKRIASILLIGGSAACASVLGLRTETNHPFEHRAHVTEGIACTRCHDGIEEAPDTGPLHLPDTQTCLQSGCHPEPHDTNECSQCHGLDFTPTRVAMAKKHLRFEHRTHLDVEKVAGNCARCHQDVKYAERTLLPKMASCLSCHQHRDTFDVADCEDCHVDLETESVRPRSHLVHEEDYIRTHGVDAADSLAVCETCHSQSECASCHGVNVPALPQRLSFDRPTLAGMHRAGFRSRHGREAARQRGLCVTCHTEESCNRCHADKGLAANGTARINPHPPGWVGIGGGSNDHGPAARRDPVSCASCHGGAGEMLCVRCHQVGGVGGNIHPPGWTSPRNPRTDAPCRLCHAP